MSIEPTNAVYQPLSEPTVANPGTISSRIAERCFTAQNLALVGTAIALVTMTVYLAVHASATKSTDDDFPHDGAFPYYCKESCSLLYKLNPGLIQKCNEYCEGTSADTFPKACILACNKLGSSVLSQCIRSCK